MTSSFLADLEGAMARQFSPAERAQIEAFRQRSREVGTAEREAIVSNTWLFCSCLPTWRKVTTESAPGHAGCIVHSGFMLTWDGRVL